MEENPMEKVMIIGCPGAGKSTLARALRDRLGLPLYPLDLLYWNADRTHVSREVFVQRLTQVLQQRRFILDGNYSATVAMRLEVCDTVILLDYPKEVCLAGIASRQGKEREDLPWVEKEADEAFLRFAAAFREEQLPNLLQLLAKAEGKRILHFTSRAETQQWLETLGKSTR